MIKLFFIQLLGFIWLGLSVAPVCLAQPDRQAVTPSGETLIEGAVVDAETRRMIVGAVVSIRYSDQNKPFTSMTITDGSFRFRLDPKRSYVIITKATGYDTKEEPFAFTSTYPTHLTGKLIRLNRTLVRQSTDTPSVTKSAPTPEPRQPATAPTKPTSVPAPTEFRLEKDVTTELRAVQFAQSTANLLPESQPELDNLLKFLRDNPKVEIELAGHTDNQGDFDKNLELSKQRADIIKQFLVKSGVAARRIRTRGYGGTRPIANNSTEETRRLNRRVEMVIRKM
ncbi:hypothetical protein GCM10023189_15770 [Nibrella saemangeumensis]|uniref:OmpA-like domain-containing protein n=1 Tax=Nibrella saemangeumensis TaxID=1084526 RepID=A0ABP8MNN4_9BACT